jgi:hypothetical protein
MTNGEQELQTIFDWRALEERPRLRSGGLFALFPQASHRKYRKNEGERQEHVEWRMTTVGMANEEQRQISFGNSITRIKKGQEIVPEGQYPGR